MIKKRVFVRVSHEFELDIPEELLDESDDTNLWALDDYIFAAFVDEDWGITDIEIEDLNE